MVYEVHYLITYETDATSSDSSNAFNKNNHVPESRGFRAIEYQRLEHYGRSRMRVTRIILFAANPQPSIVKSEAEGSISVWYVFLCVSCLWNRSQLQKSFWN